MILISTKLLIKHPKAAPDNNGAIAISHGTILAVGPAEQIIKKYPGHRIDRLQNAVLLPGLINLHTHLELPPLLDAIRAGTFPDWLRNLVRAKKTLTPDDYAAAVRANIEALVSTGTTSVAEICTHGISPSLLKQSGLRAFVFHEIISMGTGFRGKGVEISKRAPNSGLIQNGLSPHTPYTVSEAVLRQIKKSVEKHKMKLSMHVAESKDELRLLQRKRGGLDRLYQAAGWDKAWAPSAGSPFVYLKKLRLLSPDFLAVHAVQATNDDIRILKKSRTPVAHCSRSNKETGVGRMPLKKFLDAGITVGLGTDSLASSPSLNMWDEMRYALQIHRRDGVTAKDIFKLATIGGAKALGMGKEIGTLEPGKKADIIAVPLPKKNTGDIYSDLLRETKSSIMTMVDGKVLFRS